MTVKLEDLIHQMGSKYTLASVCSKRARQITRGSKVLVEELTGKPQEIALREICAGVVGPEFNPEFWPAAEIPVDPKAAPVVPVE